MVRRIRTPIQTRILVGKRADKEQVSRVLTKNKWNVLRKNGQAWVIQHRREPLGMSKLKTLGRHAGFKQDWSYQPSFESGTNSFAGMMKRRRKIASLSKRGLSRSGLEKAFMESFSRKRGKRV